MSTHPCVFQPAVGTSRKPQHTTAHHRVAVLPAQRRSSSATHPRRVKRKQDCWHVNQLVNPPPPPPASCSQHVIRTLHQPSNRSITTHSTIHQGISPPTWHANTTPQQTVTMQSLQTYVRSNDVVENRLKQESMAKSLTGAQCADLTCHLPWGHRGYVHSKSQPSAGNALHAGKRACQRHGVTQCHPVPPHAQWARNQKETHREGQCSGPHDTNTSTANWRPTRADMHVGVLARSRSNPLHKGHKTHSQSQPTGWQYIA